MTDADLELSNRMANPPSLWWWIPGAIYYGVAIVHHATFVVSLVLVWVTLSGGGSPPTWLLAVLVVSGLHAVPLALMDHEAVNLQEQLESIRS